MSSPRFIGKGNTLSDEFKIRGIKIIDIAYVAAIYLTLGAVLSITIDRQIGKFDPLEADKQSTAALYGEVLLHFACIGILMYIVRNLVEWNPNTPTGPEREAWVTGIAQDENGYLVFEQNHHSN